MIDIGHRQREACTLQQPTEVAKIRKWRNARRQAAFKLALGNGEALAQLSERVAAEKRRKEQAIRLQSAADLY